MAAELRERQAIGPDRAVLPAVQALRSISGRTLLVQHIAFPYYLEIFRELTVSISNQPNVNSVVQFQKSEQAAAGDMAAGAQSSNRRRP